VTGTGAGTGAQPRPTIRLFVELSDGISRTYDVTRYLIDAGVLRLFAVPSDASGDPTGTLASGAEVEVAAFAVGGWLRVERDLTGTS